MRQNKEAEFDNEQNNNFLIKSLTWEYYSSLLRSQPLNK